MFNKLKKLILGDPPPTAEQWLGAALILLTIAVVVALGHLAYVYYWLHKMYL